MTNDRGPATRDERLPLRGVFFDLDNTLILTRQAQRTALAAAWSDVIGARAGVDLQDVGRAFRAAYEAHFGYGTPGYAELARLTVAELYRQLSRETLAWFGVGDTGVVERLVCAHLDAERNAWALAGDAIETVEALRAAGLRVGLITNGPSALQRGKLAALALADCFDPIVIDCEFGCPKPDPRIFAHAAEAAGLSAAELLFVGDWLTDDVAGARTAGWLAVWYNADEAPLPPDTAPPDYTIRALAELLTLPPVAAALQPRAGGPNTSTPRHPTPNTQNDHPGRLLPHPG